MKSDDVKRWENEIAKNGKLADPEAPENKLFSDIRFTNGLVLRLNQMTKQVKQ